MRRKILEQYKIVISLFRQGFILTVMSLFAVATFSLKVFAEEGDSVATTILKDTGNYLYSVSKGAEDNFSFSSTDFDIKNLGWVTSYYKVGLNLSSLSNSNELVFTFSNSDDLGANYFDFFNDEVYLRYTLKLGVIPKLPTIVSADDLTISGVFLNLSDVAIQNSVSNTSITSDFLGCNQLIINTSTGSITNIKSTFLENSTELEGSAIRNEGVIEKVSSNFINNSANLGGAIYNRNNILNLTSDFINNSATTGGAIYSTDKIGLLVSNFISNISSSNGGAIYNSGDILKIESSFINNSASEDGGAIYNNGEITQIYNTSFIGNSAGGKGGAIYTTRNLSFVVDGVVEFTGNTAGTGEDIRSEAIYVDNSARLNFRISDAGRIVLNDAIDGYDYSVYVTGSNAQNDSLALYNQMKDAKLVANNVRLDMADYKATQYDFETVTLQNQVLLNIDIEYDADEDVYKSDVLVGGLQSSGVATLDNINFVGTDLKTIISNKLVVTVLDSISSNLGLRFSQSLTDKITNEIETLNLPYERFSRMDRVLPNEVSYTDNLGSVLYTHGMRKEYFGITEDNKSIGFIYLYDNDSITVSQVADTLAIINRYVPENNAEKTFNFVAEATYSVTQDLGETEGILSIKGLSSSKSIIDLGGSGGFELVSGSILNLNNVKLTGTLPLVESKHYQSTLNITNSVLDGDIVGLEGGEKYFNVNISGEHSSITGSISNTLVSLMSGKLSFNNDTFRNDNAILYVYSGVIDLEDGMPNSYYFNEIRSYQDVDYIMDLIITNNTTIDENTGGSYDYVSLQADNFYVGTNSLGGGVKVNRINYVDELNVLKSNQYIKDKISSIKTTGVPITIDSITTLDDKLSSGGISSNLAKDILDLRNEASVLVDENVKILVPAKENTKQLVLKFSEGANNTETYVTSPYRLTDSFEDEKYKDDELRAYNVVSTDELFEKTMITAFYRDTLIDSTGMGVDYIVRALEIIDKENTFSFGNVMQGILTHSASLGYERNFRLVNDYIFDPDVSVVAVTSGKVNIDALGKDYVLDFNGSSLKLNNPDTRFTFSNLTTKNMDLLVGEADVYFENTILDGQVSPSPDLLAGYNPKVMIIGDENSVTTVDTRFNNVTLQLGGRDAKDSFNGEFVISADSVRGLDFVVGENSNGTINFSDGICKIYDFNSLTINENSGSTFKIDLSLNDRNFRDVFSDFMVNTISLGMYTDIREEGIQVASDMITAMSGEGTVVLSNINLKNSLNSMIDYITTTKRDSFIVDTSLNPHLGFDIDIIDNSSDSDLTLALADGYTGEKLATTYFGSNGEDVVVRQETSWSETYAIVVSEWRYDLSVNYDNSLHVDVTAQHSKQDDIDTLYFVNTTDISKKWQVLNSKQFNTKNAEEVYTVKLNTLEKVFGELTSLGVTSGDLSIKGAIEERANAVVRSTIDFRDEYGGFTIEDKSYDPYSIPQTFKLDSVRIMCANSDTNGSVLNVEASNSSLSMRDVRLDSNNSEGLGGAVYTKSDLYIYAENADSIFAGNFQKSLDKSQSDINENDIYFAKDYNKYGVQKLNLNSISGKIISLSSGIDFDKDTRLSININTDSMIDREYIGTIRILGNVGTYEKPLAEMVINGGIFNTVDDRASTFYMDNLLITKNTLLYIDVDMLNYKNDKFVLVENNRPAPKEVYDSTGAYLGCTTFVLDSDTMKVKFGNNLLLKNKVPVLDIMGETHKFISLRYSLKDDDDEATSENEITYTTKYINDLETGIKLKEKDDYYVRLGLNGKLIIYEDYTYNGNKNIGEADDLLDKLDTFSKKSVKYNLDINKTVYDYDNYTDEETGLNHVLRTKNLQSSKFTLNGDSISKIYTPTAIEGITLSGVAVQNLENYVYKIYPNKQKFIGKNFTFEGFDGAIINKGGTVTLQNVNFVANETESNGGALRNVVYEDKYKGSISLKGKSSNYAKVYGNIATYDGGAIYNEGTMTLKFLEFGKKGYDETIGNHSLNGGAVANVKVDGYAIKGNVSKSKFVGNLADNGGGAIYTTGFLKVGSNIFDDNYAKYGGGIYVATANNKKDAVTINSDTFTKNSAVYGGAIAVGEGLVTINKDIFGTTKTNEDGNTSTEKGGAIYNYNLSGLEDNSKTTIKSSKFYNNSSKSGGAIYNAENAVAVSTKNLYGASVTSTVLVDNKKTKVTNNYYNQADNGGAIYNVGILTDSKSKYNYNTAVNGGAIYNEGKIVGVKKKKKSYVDVAGLVSGKFLYNTALNGGAIYNSNGGYLWVNKTNFMMNTAEKGGAIYNGSSLFELDTEIYELLEKNTVLRADNITVKENSAFDGGAIYNIGKIVLNKPKFTQNTANAKVFVDTELDEEGQVISTTITDSREAFGGAIYNDGRIVFVDYYGAVVDYADIELVNPTFVGNYAMSETFKDTFGTVVDALGYGGAIYNGEEGRIKITKGTFGKKDTKKVENSNKASYGGAIFNSGEVVISGVKFTNNKAKFQGGAIFNSQTGMIDDIIYVSELLYNNGGILNSNFTLNQANEGGAIYNEGDIYVGRSTFSSNKAIDETVIEETIEEVEVEVDGQIVVEDQVVMNKVVLDGQGGAIYNNSDTMSVEGSSFSKNSATQGGAIYNNGKLIIDRYDSVSVNKKGVEKHKYYDCSFTSNSAKEGGAIYLSEGASADISNTTFKNNSATNKGGAIYVGEYAQLTLEDVTFTKNKAGKGGAIFADKDSSIYILAVNKDVKFSGNRAIDSLESGDSIYLSERSVLNLGASDGRKIIINDNVFMEKDAQINKYGTGDIYIVNEGFLDGVNFAVYDSCTMKISNDRVGTLFLQRLNLSDDTKTNLCMDVSLQSRTSDKIQAETVEGTGVLNVSGVNVVTNSKTPVEIKVGEDSIVSLMTATKAESAEATYKLKSYYDENGLLRAVVYGQKAKPATVASPVATQLGGYLTQINSYDQAFMNMDLNMVCPRDEHELSGKWKVENGKCCHPEQSEGSRDSSAMPQNDGISYNAKGLWNRPYATFERVNLNNGPKVSNVGYGNFFGGDADVKQLKNGWKRQFSAYVGYNGSVQDYDRQSIDQNGGTVGITEVWYKNNFFSGLTVNAGANIAQAHTDLGRENIPMFMTGIASKTGYNFEFNRGKFIVQPSFLMSYSFIHTFEHENGKGSHVGSSPLNAIQVVPSIKFIANLKNGWQPYFNVNMRWNIIDKTHFSLRDVGIPEMSIDPYVEYGIGLQRRWGERFTGYGQAMIRNGGRNGVMLSFGFKWLL